MTGVIVGALAFGGCEQGDTTRIRDGIRASSDYASAGALRDASQAAAVVEVTKEAFRGDIRESPSVIYEAQVVDAIKNTVNGSTLRIRQLVKPKGEVWTEGPQDELRSGSRYLVFLVEAFPGESAMGDSRLVGLYGLRDGTAAYEEKNGGRFEMVPGLDPAGAMPRTILRAEV